MYGSVLCANKDWTLNGHKLVQTNNRHKHVLTETGMAVLIVCVTRRRKCSSPLTPRSEHCALSQTPTLIWTVCIIVIDILRTITLSLQWKVLSQTAIPSIASHSMSSFIHIRPIQISWSVSKNLKWLYSWETARIMTVVGQGAIQPFLQEKILLHFYFYWK